MFDNYINHVGLVLDASYSMLDNQSKLIEVTDAQIEHLARRSEELNQETRVSIYDFSDDVRCLVYDKDVLRLPSIDSIYEIRMRTALIDATMKSIEDLEQTATLYGDHAFLIYVLTDGMENQSRTRPSTLQKRLAGLPEGWTVATLVPDHKGKQYAQRVGFPTENIAIWDADSATGIDDVGATIRNATESFMVNRAKGVRSTRSLFSTGAEAVNDSTVKSMLDPLHRTQYDLIPVHAKTQIRDYVQSRGLYYTVGKAYYQLSKSEKIQSSKKIAIREKATDKVFTGDEARGLLGLPQGQEVRVTPDFNPKYDVFVQSTSVNRNLMPDTDVLVLR